MSATMVAGAVMSAMSDLSTANELITKGMTDMQQQQQRTASAAMDEEAKTHAMIMQGKIDNMKNMNFA